MVALCLGGTRGWRASDFFELRDESLVVHVGHAAKFPSAGKRPPTLYFSFGSDAFADIAARDELTRRFSITRTSWDFRPGYQVDGLPHRGCRSWSTGMVRTALGRPSATSIR